MSSSGTSGLDAFHAVVAQLDYPMVIVTVPASGCLVGFHTQCSIDPPRYVVCISRANHTHDVALTSPTLAVHVLDRVDRHLAEVFGELTGDAVDKLSLVASTPGPDGVPILDDAAAWFTGGVLDRVDLGDHTGFVLDVRDAGERRWSGQLGFQRAKDLDAGHPPRE